MPVTLRAGKPMFTERYVSFCMDDLLITLSKKSGLKLLKIPDEPITGIIRASCELLSFTK